MHRGIPSHFKIGILGGGQLGRMLIQSAINLNLNISILDPDPEAPCKLIAGEFQVGELTDPDTVYEFGSRCDLITIEIENVNTDALKKLRSEGKQVFPQPEIIEIIQDKRKQKQFYEDHGIPTSPFILTDTLDDIRSNCDFLPAVNKISQAGYDGRGVQILKTEDQIEQGFDAPGFLEKFVDFEKEISVIVARNEDGEVRNFPVAELVFHPQANLVEYLFSPAKVNDDIRSKAITIAKKLIKRLDMVGLLAVEMFVTRKGEVLVNESAPRTHNSGHHTIEGNVTSQFEQHLRAICNMPLGNTDTLIPAAMVNLLGAEGYSGEAIYEGLAKVLKLDGVHVHLYGKKLTKPFRKMGHVTITGDDVNSLREKVELVKESLKVIA